MESPGRLIRLHLDFRPLHHRAVASSLPEPRRGQNGESHAGATRS